MLGILPSLTCASEGVMDPQQKELAVARQGVECCSFSSSSFIVRLRFVEVESYDATSLQGRRSRTGKVYRRERGRERERARERERERDGERDGETERAREGERERGSRWPAGCLAWCSY